MKTQKQHYVEANALRKQAMSMAAKAAPKAQKGSVALKTLMSAAGAAMAQGEWLKAMKLMEKVMGESPKAANKTKKSLGDWAGDVLTKAGGTEKAQALDEWSDQALVKSKKFSEEVIAAKVREELRWCLPEALDTRAPLAPLITKVTDAVILHSLHSCKAELKAVMGSKGREAVEALVQRELPAAVAQATARMAGQKGVASHPAGAARTAYAANGISFA